MHFRSLTAIIVRAFTSQHLNKPYSKISTVDIKLFLSSLTRFNQRTDVARQILHILFGKIPQDYDVLLGIVGNWMREVNALYVNRNFILNYQVPDYHIVTKNWRITKHYPTFIPHELVINEMNNIILVEYYEFQNGVTQSRHSLQEWNSQPMDMVSNTQSLKQVPQQPSTTQMQIPEVSNSIKKKTIRMFDPPDHEVENINNAGKKKIRNVSQPLVNKWINESSLLTKSVQYSQAQEISISVRSILNEICPDNMYSLTEHFKTLPINNIIALETAVSLVFEKAIEKRGFAPLCSSLCTAMQSVEVISNNGKEVTFKKLLISKCESLFEIDLAQEMDFAKKLTLCKEPEKKKKLKLEYEKNKRTSHERSIRNCRFMGELFKQKIITPNIMMYHIDNLSSKHFEEPLECLCVLLKTAGKELQQTCNLNNIFDQLNALAYKNTKSKIPLKIILMLKDVINVRINNWNDDRYDAYQILINYIKNVSNEQQPMLVAKNIPEEEEYHLHIYNKISSMELPVLLKNTAVDFKMYTKCKNILEEYERLQNLDDIIHSISEDEFSVTHTKYEEFVKSMSLITLDSPITQTTEAGMIFAELLSKKILSMAAITQGFDDILKCWNDFSIDYPQFFSYIAAIIAPLLSSPNASFDFNSLKDSCTSIRPDNSSKLFTEILYKIISFKKRQNFKEELRGVLWIYNKWNMLENVSLDVFMPNNQINKYFKKDQIGVFLLSIYIYDKIKLTDDKELYDNLQNWICTNISAEIIQSSRFVRALTIALVILCLKLNHSYEDFFDHVHVKLLTRYINFKPLPKLKIQLREVQCMFGIQIMSATLKHPRGMVLKLFNKLYQEKVISKDSFELFIKEYEKIAEI